MATGSNTLAWKAPWTETPGRLQYMESQRDTTERFHFHFFNLHLMITLIKLFGFFEGGGNFLQST